MVQLYHAEVPEHTVCRFRHLYIHKGQLIYAFAGDHRSVSTANLSVSPTDIPHYQLLLQDLAGPGSNHVQSSGFNFAQRLIALNSLRLASLKDEPLTLTRSVVDEALTCP